MIFLRARWYNPADGRFQSRDTWGGNSNNPMSFNRWSYVEGNPINRIDPTGLTPWQKGYLEGDSVTSPGFGVAAICGWEIVYDYATMSRARFSYCGDVNGFYASVGSKGIYFGGVTGFKYEDKALSVGLNSYPDMKYSNKIVEDYEGLTDGWYAGAGVNPIPEVPILNVGGGVGYFHSSNGYINGAYAYFSVGISPSPLKFEGVTFHTRYKVDNGALQGYNNSGIEYYYDVKTGNVNRGKLLSDILSGDHSPISGALGYVGATRIGQISFALIAAREFEKYYYRPVWAQCNPSQSDTQHLPPLPFPPFPLPHIP